MGNVRCSSRSTTATRTRLETWLQTRNYVGCDLLTGETFDLLQVDSILTRSK
jgi:hypothetical protein